MLGELILLGKGLLKFSSSLFAAEVWSLPLLLYCTGLYPERDYGKIVLHNVKGTGTRHLNRLEVVRFDRSTLKDSPPATY
jgi:hypothetical protein